MSNYKHITTGKLFTGGEVKQVMAEEIYKYYHPDGTLNTEDANVNSDGTITVVVFETEDPFWKYKVIELSKLIEIND